MSTYHVLLISEPPLQVLPSLAVKIGLRESIVLLQLHDLLLHSNNHLDGYVWVSNTYASWQKVFPFLTYDVVQKTFLTLERLGLLVSTDAYNTDPLDRTKWYRIDRDAVASVVEEVVS